MRAFRFGLLLSVILISCGSYEKKGEDTSEDVAPEAVVDTADTVQEEIPVMLEPPALKTSFSGDVFNQLDSLISYFLSAYDTIPSRRSILPERFGSERQRKITLQRKDRVLLSDSTQVLPEANIWVFHFSDTTQMQLVIRNWFLEFGDSRAEIRIGESANVSSDPMLVVLRETDLMVLQTSCRSYQFFSWEALENSFLVVYNQKINSLQVDCNGRLVWR